MKTQACSCAPGLGDTETVTRGLCPGARALTWGLPSGVEWCECWEQLGSYRGLVRRVPDLLAASLPAAWMQDWGVKNPVLELWAGGKPCDSWKCLYKATELTQENKKELQINTRSAPGMQCSSTLRRIFRKQLSS